MNEFRIKDRVVSNYTSPLVIAEIGINHEGSLKIAKEMIDSAIKAGAEVIKHQTHIVEDEMSEEAKKVIPGNSNDSIYDIMDRCSLSERDEFEMMKYVEKKGAIFISTPFSRKAVDRLEKFDVPAYKIGSGECNNYPLVKYICEKGKPIILSTGMNSLDSIRESVEIIRNYKIPFALLHCTNIYPTPPELVRLDSITLLKREFPDALVGLSDHTTSNYTCLGAVSLGASILERHFTDHYDRKGPDINCSMDHIALKDLINGSRIIFSARGENKNPIEEEKQTIAFAFASVVAIKDIKKGQILTKENIWVKRPGNGDFLAKDIQNLYGKIAKHDIIKGHQLKKRDI